MKRALMCGSLLVCLALIGVPRSRAAQGSSEEAAAKVPLQLYFEGHAKGDGAFMRKAFHSDAKICSNNQGKLACLTAEEFAGRFTAGPAKDEAQRKRSIESLDITGDTAVAKLILDYPTVKFTDYMSLMKVNGEWKIMNKIYFADRRTPPGR